MKDHLSNFSSSSFSENHLAVKQSKQVEHVEIIDSVSSNNSLDPNEPDKGLKCTLKSRHLAVRITKKKNHINYAKLY
jgi:hypothetical protein